MEQVFEDMEKRAAHYFRLLFAGYVLWVLSGICLFLSLIPFWILMCDKCCCKKIMKKKKRKKEKKRAVQVEAEKEMEMDEAAWEEHA